MPRKLIAKLPFEEIEDEILFTQAALAADPDAKDLVPLTESWLALIDKAQATELDLRRQVAHTDAARMVANARLDQACIAFADELWMAAGKDRAATRFKQFFREAPRLFVRMALPRQIAQVRAWLESRDEVFLRHKPNLEKWVQEADAALVATRALALKRGESAIARDELASDLTRERDGLAENLAARARERKLDRAWPKTFFRTGPSRPAKDEIEEEIGEEASAAE